MVHIDVKKVGRIPNGGGWRVHGRHSARARAVDRAKRRDDRPSYVYLHSAVDGHTRLAYTEALDDEKGTTAAGFLDRAKAWFAKHGTTSVEPIVTDNGACYRSKVFAEAVLPARQQRIKPYTPRHNGKVERYNRILAEEFLYAAHGCRSRNAPTPSRSGTFITTTTDPTEHTTDGHPPPLLRPASTTSWPHTTSQSAVAPTAGAALP